VVGCIAPKDDFARRSMEAHINPSVDATVHFSSDFRQATGVID
jgi:hypothetical protein